MWPMFVGMVLNATDSGTIFIASIPDVSGHTYRAAMDILAWLQWPLVAIAASVLTLVLTVAGLAAWPPTWETRLREVAEEEVRRRLVNQRATMQVHIAVARLLGEHSDQPGQHREREDSLDDIIQVLLGTTHQRAQFVPRLEKRRSQLEGAALQRQVRSVHKIASFELASYVWVAMRAANALSFVAGGFFWLLPRSAKNLTALLVRRSNGASIVGLGLGLLVAVATASTAGSAGASWFDVMMTGGEVAVVSVISINAAMLLKAVFVAQFGDPRRWPRKQVVLSAALAVTLIGLLNLVSSGVWMNLQTQVLDTASDYLARTAASKWVGGILFAITLGYMLRNAVSWLRARTLVIRERTEALGAIALIAILALGVAATVFGLPIAHLHVPVRILFYLFGILIVLSLGFRVVEWIQMYRSLLAQDRLPVRRGFRWWALVAWITASVIERLLLLAASPEGALSLNSAAGLLASTLAASLTLILSLTFIPGVAVTALFVRRVHVAYRDWVYQQAPRHSALERRR